MDDMETVVWRETVVMNGSVGEGFAGEGGGGGGCHDGVGGLLEGVGVAEQAGFAEGVADEGERHR